jgi:AbrB family looped-hinge helix DNA binding protein
MTTVTVSPKFEVVIPVAIRESLGLRPGQKLQAIQYQGRITLIPERPIGEARGLLKGILTSVRREDDDRL